jgi:hypothetical protein
MPVDKPKPGETQEEYLKYCIPAEINEGMEGDQAAAVCYSYYESGKMTTQKLFVEELKKYIKSNSR